MERSNAALSFAAGGIRLDRAQRTLVIRGQPAKLGGRAFDLLEALVERRDRVVPKQELLDVVWPGLIVEENNLQVHVVTLRKLLGQQSIATVPGRGYRFTLEPDHHNDLDDVETSAGSAAEHSPLASARSLIGRASLVADAVELLRRPETRLLTLTGPGGSGKTRLGLRVTADLAHAYASGSYAVMLAPIRSPDHVASAIATVLNVQEAGPKAPQDLLITYLREREVLLMLDNFEHLSKAIPLLLRILDDCPRVTILVTSRTVLHAPGEVALVVPPLGIPDRSASGAALLEAPAVRLFVDRALAVGRRIDPHDPAELAAVSDICRRLDGLPLAIELAAARLRVLSPRALRDRLGSRLALLRGEAPGVPERQQTLRGAIAWSHELLTDGARIMFRRLAVFVGGWALDAAESVCAGSARDGDALDVLSELLDHSLVQRVDDVGGEPRFAILETVREFAQEQLEASGESTAVRQRHAEWFLELATAAAPQLTSVTRRPWLQRLTADHNNLRSALSWFVLEQADPERALALAGVLPWYWYFSGQYGEGRAWIGLTLNLVDEARRDAAVARILSGAARLAIYAGATNEAVALARRSVGMWRETGDRRGLAFALVHEGIPLLAMRQRDAARALLRESKEHFVTLADPWGVAFATTYEGISLVYEAGTEEEAYPLLHEGRARFQALGDEWGVTTSSHYLGSLALRNGDYESARTLTEEMLASARDLGDNYRVARNLHQLAEIALAQQDLRCARHHLVESLALNRDQGRIGDGALQLRLLARLLAMTGRHDHAARLFGAASPHEDRERTLPPDDAATNDEVMAAARATLGERRFDTEWTHGAAMSFDDATRWVLTLEESNVPRP